MLTQAEQINRLTVAQAAMGYAVDIRGVVTYADLKLGHIFLQDRTAGEFVYFHPAGTEPDVEPGQTRGGHGYHDAGGFLSVR